MLDHDLRGMDPTSCLLLYPAIVVVLTLAQSSKEYRYRTDPCRTSELPDSLWLRPPRLPCRKSVREHPLGVAIDVHIQTHPLIETITGLIPDLELW